MSKKNILHSSDALTKSVLDAGITTWDELILYVQHLPYGRNSNRSNLALVMQEQRGTCSSKHAFLQSIAVQNNIEFVKLILGMYRMTEYNTPKVATVIRTSGLPFIPEAHCYLEIRGKRCDFTTPESSIQHLEHDILEEQYIVPTQVGAYKVGYHKAYIKKWAVTFNRSFEEVWEIREACIAALSL